MKYLPASNEMEFITKKTQTFKTTHSFLVSNESSFLNYEFNMAVVKATNTILVGLQLLTDPFYCADRGGVVIEDTLYTTLPFFY